MSGLVLLSFIVTIVLVNGEERTIFPKVGNDVEYTENELCKAESEIYMMQLENLTLWAHEMWDASAKYTTGQLRGNIYQMGDWDECVTINGPYLTQYCLATIIANVPPPDPPRDPLSLRFEPYETVLNKIYKIEDVSIQSRHEVQKGLCIPASCRPKDLESSLNTYLAKIKHNLMGENVTYSARVAEELCQTADEGYDLDRWDIGFCCLTIIITILVLSSTFYDYLQSQQEKTQKIHREKSLSQSICLTFSARKNFMDLPRAHESNPALSILHGIKTVSMFMIITDHRFGTFLSGPIINFDYVEEQYRSKFAVFIGHGDLFVDSFFLLSGLLVAYGLLLQFEKKIISPLFIICMRYIRLTPVYAFVIFYWGTMFNHIGSGPLWKLIVAPEIADCRQNWWTNLLYLNNYINDDHMCMIHSWYLPCDFHFFIVGIFVIMAVKKNKRFGLSILTFLFLLSIVVPFAIVVGYSRQAVIQFYPTLLRNIKGDENIQLTYTKSHTRSISYVIGMFAGYFYYLLKDSSKQLSRIASHSLTLASFLVILISLASGAVFYDRYHEYNAIEAGFYASLHRVAWCAGTVGLLLSASYGHAGVLKDALSWSVWIPLGKLGYGAYLVHLSFQFRSVAMSTSPKYFNYFDVICLSLGDIVLAYGTALLLYLGIEAPVRKIFKLLLTPSNPVQRKAELTIEEIATTADNSRP